MPISDTSIDMSQRSKLWRRRDALPILAWMGLGLPRISTAARAANDDNVTKAAAWILGNYWGFAAILHLTGAPHATVEPLLLKAKNIANELGIEIKPFPAKVRSVADIIHYVIEDDGSGIRLALSKKYGDEQGVLFTDAVLCALLYTFYSPGTNFGPVTADTIQSQLESINLPRDLWIGVVKRAHNNKDSQHDVKNAVEKMQKDIANYFVPGSWQ